MRDLKASLLAVLACTLVLGVALPLAFTGVAQVLAPGRADGSLLHAGGRTVGSSLLGQDFSRRADAFQARPSATGSAADATAFNNQGPNQRALARQLRGFVRAYLRRERPYSPGLTAARIPADAVTTSASGIDPAISESDARIQARRVAARRGLPLARVLALVHDASSRPLFGLAGPRSVNVTELNAALERER